MQPPPPLSFSSSLLSPWYRRLQLRRRRRRCRGILLAAAATSIAAVAAGIAPPSLATTAVASVAVDAFLSPPFLLSRYSAGGSAARLLCTILALGRPRLLLPSELYWAMLSEEGGFRIPPPLFPPPEPEPASVLLSQRRDWIDILN